MSAEPRVALVLRVSAARARTVGARCAARVLDREAARDATDHDALRDAAAEILARGRSSASAHAAAAAVVDIAHGNVDRAVKLLARDARLTAATWLRRAAEKHPPPADDDDVRAAGVAAATAMRAACVERLRVVTAHGARGAYALLAAANDLEWTPLPAPYGVPAPCATCRGERRVPKPADRDLGYPFAPCPACVPIHNE